MSLMLIPLCPAQNLNIGRVHRAFSTELDILHFRFRIHLHFLVEHQDH